MALSHELFAKAKVRIPGGVNSPVRAFNGVGGDPVFFRRAEGARLFDADGKQYIDYVGSWGPMILGHAHPDVIAAVCEAAHNGLSFGAPTEIETVMADRICDLIPIRRDGAHGEFGHRGDHERHPSGSGPIRPEIRSSSSRVVITAIPTRCWSRPVPGH